MLARIAAGRRSNMRITPLVLLVLLIGCDDQKANPATPPPITVQPSKRFVEVESFQFNYNGHAFIGFGWGVHSSGVVHDPDCPKCNHGGN